MQLHTQNTHSHEREKERVWRFINGRKRGAEGDKEREGSRRLGCDIYRKDVTPSSHVVI